MVGFMDLISYFEGFILKIAKKKINYNIKLMMASLQTYFII